MRCMNIRDIERYIEENGIIFDFDNNPKFIDYIDRLPCVSNEQTDKMIAEMAKEFRKLAKDKGIIVIDSLGWNNEAPVA